MPSNKQSNPSKEEAPYDVPELPEIDIPTWEGSDSVAGPTPPPKKESDDSSGDSSEPLVFTGQKFSKSDRRAADFLAVFTQLYEEMSSYLSRVPTAESIHELALKLEQRIEPDAGKQIASEGSAAAKDTKSSAGEGTAQSKGRGTPPPTADELGEGTARIARGAHLYALSKFSGQSVDYLRNHPDVAKELSVRMTFDPSRPKLSADPMVLLMEALEKEYIMLPETINAEMKKLILSGKLTWNAMKRTLCGSA